MFRINGNLDICIKTRLTLSMMKNVTLLTGGFNDLFHLVIMIELQSYHRPGSYLVKKSPDYVEYPDFPVPDYECQRIDDIDAEYYDEKGCHPPCSVRRDPAGTYCDIYDFEVVMKPSNNQTQDREGNVEN